MANQPSEDLPKVSPSSTKKQILDAFNQLRSRFQEQAQLEMKPEKVREERKEREVIEVAEAAASGSIPGRLDGLRIEIGNALSDISTKLEEETSRYSKIKEAIAIKERELKEMFELEKSAFALAALIESHRQKSTQFEEEMQRRRETLQEEIGSTRAAWEREKKEHRQRVEEERSAEEKDRKRHAEEYEYNLKREQGQKHDQFEDEMAQLEKELEKRREEFENTVKEKERDLKEMDSIVSEREKNMDQLQKAVDSVPKELENAVNKATKDVGDALRSEAKKNQELMAKQFEGERNVLTAKIEALEKVVVDQKAQIEVLSRQLENAYSKVQDIAVTAVASARTPPATAPRQEASKAGPEGS